MMNDLPRGKKIIVFDGLCNMCDRLVQYIIAHDKKDVFRFVSLQSELGQEIIKHIGIDLAKTDSIILYEPGVAYYYKSAAAIEVAKSLGGLWNLGTALRLVPAALRNSIYDYIARNRYRWYGKKEECMAPTPDLKSKFL